MSDVKSMNQWRFEFRFICNLSRKKRLNRSSLNFASSHAWVCLSVCLSHSVSVCGQVMVSSSSIKQQ